MRDVCGSHELSEAYNALRMSGLFAQSGPAAFRATLGAACSRRLRTCLKRSEVKNLVARGSTSAEVLEDGAAVYWLPPTQPIH